ncbi:MAG: ricin-type beta-trefoil lectin domain protein [Nakamurella sp.]
MSILLLVVLLGLALSALLVPMIITSSRTSTFDKTRVQALDAAQAGVDVTLGSIRSSTDTIGGVSAKLPCGPGTGVVNGASAAAYSVVVEYFTVDPAGQSYPSPNAMKCVSGYGPYDLVSGATTPSYARITSTGSVGTPTNGSSPSRTLSSTYVFRTSDAYTLGGVVQIAPTGSASLCLDVGTAPAGGTPVVIQACSTTTPPTAQQVFAYRVDLTLQLVSSVTAATPNGLCLSPAQTPAVAGDAVKLSPCVPLGLPPTYTQQWSYNDNGQYQAAQSTSVATGTLPNLCMNVLTQAAGQPVIVGSCGSAWIPSASVGAGAAALPQWVNFSEFGRCLDVTAQNVNSTYLIDYPCKQNPNPAAKTWNQLFTAPPNLTQLDSVTGPIYTTNGGVPYCLTSSGTDGGYVTVKTCVTGSALQTWTIYTGKATLSYSRRYTIVSGGLCLGLGAPNAALTTWSTIVSEACTGSKKQKWNGVASALNSAVTNTYEK